MISDHNPDHYRFQRTQARHSPALEHSQPVSGYGVELLRLSGIVACVALLWALVAAIS